MSLRQLRARLDRLEVRFPGDEESIARARYEHLHRRVSCGELELLTNAEKAEHSELTMSLVVWLPPATTDEERAARARWNDLRHKSRRETLEPLTEAEQIEFDELTIRYHFNGDAIKAWRDVAKKQRAEGEERSRLQQLERQKKAAAAARLKPAANSSGCPGGTGAKDASNKVRQVEPKRDAAAAAGVINYEDNSDCWPIDDEDL
jgi:hypothetical protein